MNSSDDSGGPADLDAATRKFQKELNAGAVSLVLLGLLARRRRAMYGYEIAKALEAQAAGALPMNQGAIYPALRSLERQGLLDSTVEPSVSGPPRKYYGITGAGQRALRNWRKAWSHTARFVDCVVEGDHEHRSPPASAKVSGVLRKRAQAGSRRRA